ncbi:arginine--tRNA ligase [Candidatus Roizmanbacteria bacterium CG_4_10_14_0_8_um_filter_33_9]|uniref:Arginine--tRNA ligase n=1 Tax=Candidatus Roizmanbacteria bacterium CG_4_10_14_0_8_um_filter_33_9 TaxID=1974826 RepID=A0A2M7QHW1_9BACT|nr:MAG: arginine--tRNA ligase [Candidatus Roizmanbacteria bacterium CG_4_10_14_0_8_um_filter_33_9]
MIKEQITKELNAILEKMNIKDIDISLDIPSKPEHGDFASSIALKLTKILKKNPYEIAQEIASYLPKKIQDVEKIEVIKPGFINFWISKNQLISHLDRFAKGTFEFPKVHLGINKQIMVEFAHPNTLKLFHIGHLRNISIGESIVRILEAVGNKVIRANYQGDVGLHTAKCMWGIKQMIKEKGEHMFVSLTLQEKIALIGKAYADGQNAYENEIKKQEIIDINRQIYEKDPKVLDLWKKTRQWSLDYYEVIYKRLYSSFNRYYFESESPERGVEIVKGLLKEGVLEKSKGAVVFNGKKYGLDTRVFINSLGFPTYEGKELALAEKEFTEFGELDKCIHVVTPEQTSFFKVTFKVEELIDEKKYGNKQYHLAYGWVNLSTGKMSSRTGNVVEASWLLDEIKKRINKKFNNLEEASEVLTIASAKYAFLKNTIANDIAFSIDESVSLDGNSAPYLLYTYVRTQSILSKNTKTETTKATPSYNDEELDILRFIQQFEIEVKHSAEELAPNFIANYLFDLAKKYNLFYQKNPILKADGSQKYLRIQITKAVGHILKTGLYLLGIKTVDKM